MTVSDSDVIYSGEIWEVEDGGSLNLLFKPFDCDHAVVIGKKTMKSKTQIERAFMPILIEGISENGSCKDYYHATLTCDSDESWTVDKHKYRANPYPVSEVYDVEVYQHETEDKMWGITKHGTAISLFYANEKTDGRIVHQVVEPTDKSIAERIDDKTAKGYRYKGTYTYSDKHYGKSYFNPRGI